MVVVVDQVVDQVVDPEAAGAAVRELVKIVRAHGAMTQLQVHWSMPQIRSMACIGMSGCISL